MSMSAKPGVCYLVGAGPGDPRLITLRGLELLRTADVVLYDALVNPLLLREVRADAICEDVGKRFAKESATQNEINARMITHSRAGRSVVRLKGGDPMVFGRGGEELEALAGAGVPFEVVPGVSALSAVTAYAGIPLTHREDCSDFFAMTATRETASADFARLASMEGTRVLFMGVSQLEACVDAMLAACADPTTPVAVIQWGTRGQQRCVTGDLANIVNIVRSRNITQPALVVIGGVVRHRSRLGWWESQPLFGLRVLITASQSDTVRAHVAELLSLGAEVGWEPLVETTPLASKEISLPMPGVKQVVLFTSARAVEIFLATMSALGRDVRSLADCHIVGCGGPTHRALRAAGLIADAQFPAGVLLNVAEHLDDFAKKFSDHVLWYCGDLSEAGWLPVSQAKVERVVLYHTQSRMLNEKERERIHQPWDVVIFLSPSAVDAWSQNGLQNAWCNTALAVGSRTLEKLQKHFFERVVCASKADWGSVLKKLFEMKSKGLSDQ